MPERFKSLFLSVFLLLSGVVLLFLTASSTLRFPRAEAAGYLCLAMGALATLVTAYRALRYVKPSLGYVVHFWGPDGRSKLVGRIAAMEGQQFVVESAAGRFNLDERHLLRVERP